MGTINEHNGGRVVTSQGVPAILPLGTVEPVEKYGVTFSLLSLQAAKQSWPEMPYANRLLLGGGLLLAGLGALIPIYSAWAQAIFPYTAAGKQETCVSNLQALGLALAAYSRDSDNTFPPMDVTTTSGERITWVNRLSGYAKPDVLQCPAGPSVAAGLSNYAMNPVFSGKAPVLADNTNQTIAFADGGGKHDVSLLPPFPSWPYYVQGGLPNTASGSSQTNLDFRHSGKADILFLDGHADSADWGDWVNSPNPWGGVAVTNVALDRMADHSAVDGDFMSALENNNIGQATSDLKNAKDKLSADAQGLESMWLLYPGAKRPEDLDNLGWRAAAAMESIGDESVQQALDTQTVQEANDELSQDTAAKSVLMGSSQGFAVTLPSTWRVEEKPEQNVNRTYFRSDTPNVYAVFETVFKPTATGNGPIQWAGMENSLQRQLGSRYRLIGKSWAVWNGQTASTWQFEEDRPSCPKLRKMYFGYYSGFQSHVALFVAPSGAFDGWKGVFVNAVSPK